MNGLFSKWWALGDSNSRPSPCKGDALPTELNAQFILFIFQTVWCLEVFLAKLMLARTFFIVNTYYETFLFLLRLIICGSFSYLKERV